MFLLYMAHQVGMGVGDEPAITGTAIWYLYANTQAVK